MQAQIIVLYFQIKDRVFAMHEKWSLRDFANVRQCLDRETYNVSKWRADFKYSLIDDATFYVDTVSSFVALSQ